MDMLDVTDLSDLNRGGYDVGLRTAFPAIYISSNPRDSMEIVTFS